MSEPVENRIDPLKFAAELDASLNPPEKNLPESAVFKTPQNVLDYLETLINEKHRPLKWLKMDIADDTSEDKVRTKIVNAGKIGIFDKDETEKILAMLDQNEKVETEVKNGESEKSEPEKPSRDFSSNKYEESYKGFRVPQETLEIMDEIIGRGKNLQLLKKKIKYADSFERVTSEIETASIFRSIDAAEKQELMESLKPIEPKDDEPELESEPESPPAPKISSIASPEPPSQPATPKAAEGVVVLKNQRADYRKVLVEHKNAVRQKKNVFAKILSDLGMEKQMPETDKPQPLKEAEKIYISTKKQKMAEILAIPVSNLEIDALGLDPNLSNEEKINAVYKVRAVDQAELEWDILQRNILEEIPPLERGRIRKGFEWWAKQKLPVRIAMSTTLMTGVGLALGTVAVGGIGATLAYKGARSLGSAALGQKAGAFAGRKMQESSEERTEQAKEIYGKELNENNFEQKEKDFMQFKEKEQNQLKRNVLKKAGVMLAVGVGANLGENLLTKGIHAVVPDEIQKSGVGPPRPEHISPPKAQQIVEKVSGGSATPTHHWWNDIFGKSKPSAQNQPVHSSAPAETPKVAPPPPETPLAPKAETISPPASKIVPTEIIKGTEVKLSSRGFIRDIENMKNDLHKMYPDASKVPPELKHVYETSPTKLAQEYGFYKPGAAEDSALSHQGESMELNSKGQIVYHELGGKTEIIDTDTHKFVALHPDKMFAPKAPAPHETAPTQPAPIESSAQPNSAADPFNHPRPEGQTAPTAEPIYHGAPVSQSPEFGPLDQYGEPIAHSAEHLPSHPPVLPLDQYGQPMEHPSTSPHSFDLPDGNKLLHVSIAEAVTGHKQILVDNVKIAESVPSPNGDGGTMMQLLDKYQDGKKYASFREAFDRASSDADILKNFPKAGDGREIMQIPFEKGRIDVFHSADNGQNSTRVFLNGKEIAKGLLTAKGPRIKILPGVPKGGIFLADTVYERALKHAMPIIKTLKTFQK